MTLLPEFSTYEFSKKEMNDIKYFISPVPVREIGLIYHTNYIKTKLMIGIEKIIKQKIDSLAKKVRKVDVIKPF